MRAAAVLALLVVATASAAAAQQNAQRCIFVVQFVGDTGRQITSTNGVDYFAGGRVRLGCRGTSISMESDSVAAYNGAKLVYFIGKVKYRDSTVTLDADNGTYYKDGERWEARGNVATKNLVTGSTLTGPSVDYFRKVKGIRDTAETYAIGRPTINYLTADSGAKAPEPYVIVGDRVRLKGDDRVWAAGKVTVDRSDFAARGDSMRLDTGGRQDGSLIGSPLLRGLTKDTFALTGTRIDFTLAQRELKDVIARGDGHLVSRERDLVADTIKMVTVVRQLTRTLAWGKTIRPYAVSSAYAVRGDSVAFYSPGEVLQEAKAYGHAWAGAARDSTAGKPARAAPEPPPPAKDAKPVKPPKDAKPAEPPATGAPPAGLAAKGPPTGTAATTAAAAGNGIDDRDWITGDSVYAKFASRDGATRLLSLTAFDNASAYYRGRGDGKAAGSLTYARGDRIFVQMRGKGAQGVARVDIHGEVDGLQLEPGPAKPSGSAPPPRGAP